MSESKDAVLRFYEAAASGDPDALAATVHEDFRAEAPPMLPWGGVTEGRDAVIARILPQLAANLNLETLKIASIYGEGEKVFVTLTAETLRGEPVMLGEDWTLRDGKPAAVRVYWFDPRPITDALAD
ncbi:nuclear transport factor 2 family protein [Brevundimonas sp.]|uniref:nuclear transport factor 2 family protein n=1 Tax=Brevundimonas sp. TaxID=1871086 RepID=UPI0017AD8633|nr:nuclear transport factor 2 family protein [Brevundimonas sp.]MBA4806362.1 nuclear transport factor 2 family protein [Brevundimonas sp.]